MLSKLMNLLGVSAQPQAQAAGTYKCKTYAGCTKGELWYCPNSTASGCEPSGGECC